MYSHFPVGIRLPVVGIVCCCWMTAIPAFLWGSSSIVLTVTSSVCVTLGFSSRIGDLGELSNPEAGRAPSVVDFDSDMAVVNVFAKSLMGEENTNFEYYGTISWGLPAFMSGRLRAVTLFGRFDVSLHGLMPTRSAAMDGTPVAGWGGVEKAKTYLKLTGIIRNKRKQEVTPSQYLYAPRLRDMLIG